MHQLLGNVTQLSNVSTRITVITLRRHSWANNATEHNPSVEVLGYTLKFKKFKVMGKSK